MNCDWVQENIPLYLYNELADDARHELEGHIERCPGCADELKAMRAFHGEMTGLPQLEVTPNLLTSARIQLSDALGTVRQRKRLALGDGPDGPVAAGALLARPGSGYLHGRLRRRHRHHVSHERLAAWRRASGQGRKPRSLAFETSFRSRAATECASTTNGRCRRRCRAR